MHEKPADPNANPINPEALKEEMAHAYDGLSGPSCRPTPAGEPAEHTVIQEFGDFLIFEDRMRIRKSAIENYSTEIKQYRTKQGDLKSVEKLVVETNTRLYAFDAKLVDMDYVMTSVADTGAYAVANKLHQLGELFNEQARQMNTHLFDIKGKLSGLMRGIG